MKHVLFALFLSVTVAFAGICTFANIGSAAGVSKVMFGGKTYYRVTSTDPNMDTGDEVCVSIGQTCIGFAQANNAVCKLFHPDAKALVSVNGSRYDFYCNGAPQQDIACSRTMNTCQTCPACNPNNTCSSPIGQHYREMFVECAPKNVPVSGNGKSAGAISLNRPKPPASSARSVGTGGGDPRIGTYPGKVICEFYQMTNAGDFAKSNKKLATCAAYKAADHYCTIVMQSQYARAERCDEHGIIICSNPCNPPTYQLPISRCAFDNDRPRGNQAPPIRFCSSSSKAASTQPAKKSAGQTCQHGGDCQSGMCLGVVPGQHYVCSCIDPTTRWQSCKK